MCGGGGVKDWVSSSINKTILALESGFFVQIELHLSTESSWKGYGGPDSRGLTDSLWSLHPSPASLSLLR